MAVFLIFRNDKFTESFHCLLFEFLEFLCFPDCLTRMLYFKFQAVFEKKTEEHASSSVINEIKVLCLGRFGG